MSCWRWQRAWSCAMWRNSKNFGNHVRNSLLSALVGQRHKDLVLCAAEGGISSLTEDSTEDDPIVRIKGHSASGEFDFTRHIKDIDPSNASYAEMCALIGWEERINPSGKKGLLMPTPLGMDVGNVTRKQNFVDLSSRYLASGKFSQSIADQTKELLELYQKLMQSNRPTADDLQTYATYRRVNDLALSGLMKRT